MYWVLNMVIELDVVDRMIIIEYVVFIVFNKNGLFVLKLVVYYDNSFSI